MYIDAHNRPTGHSIHHLATALAERIGNRLRRRKLKTLLELDDAILKDIGVTRGEVETVTHLPLSVNAAVELRRVSLERRRAERKAEYPA